MTEQALFSRRFRRAVDKVIRFPSRQSFLWRNRTRLDASASAIATVRKSHAGAVTAGLENVATVHSVSLFVLVVEQDLYWLTHDLMLAGDEEHRAFIARQMAVLLYELVEDLPQILGKKCGRALAALGIEAEFEQSLKKAKVLLNEFKRAHAERLNEIRNIAGAHRDHDARLQLDLIEKIVPIEIMKLGAEFSVSLRALVADLTRLTLRIADWDVMLRDRVQGARKRANPE